MYPMTCVLSLEGDPRDRGPNTDCPREGSREAKAEEVEGEETLRPL